MHAGKTHSNTDRHRALAGTSFYMLLGPIVWAIHLTVIYISHAVLCARGIVGSGVISISSLVFVATGAALAVLIAAIAVANGRRRAVSPSSATASAFQHSVMGLLAVVSATGVGWAGATALIVPPCLALR